MLGRIAGGTPVGLVAYRQGKPVGWISVAPKATFRGLGGPEPEPGETIWSLTCMFIPRKLRGAGHAHAFITAAVAHARAAGATTLEAYPVNPDSPSYRFMGFVAAFEKAGFTHVGAAGSRRHVMRLAL
jgi:GNAT superfamily N-acetyltransferase